MSNGTLSSSEYAEIICNKLRREDNTYYFTSKKDAIDFLKDDDVQKDMCKRVFSYLFMFDSFDTLNGEGSIEQILRNGIKEIIDNYSNLIKEYDCESEPLSRFDKKSRPTIEADFPRSYNFFVRSSLAADFRDDIVEDDFKLKFCRLFCVLEYEGIKYLQGFDRIFFNVFSMLHIAFRDDKILLGCSESIAYKLVKSMTGYIFYEELLNEPDNLKIFKLIDRDTPKKLAYILKREGNDSSTFALRWLMLLFSDEYKNQLEVILIWDSVILHRRKDELMFYIVQLSLAHLEYIAQNSNLPDDLRGRSMVQFIQEYSAWDVKKILKATKRAYTKKGVNKIVAVAAIGLAFAVSFGIMLYLSKRGEYV